ncbi:MAG: DUF502 domain-containing protein [Bacteroidia bacterium]|nr:DUF502 domain-containing protein [Bacteroidia bacterium]
MKKIFGYFLEGLLYTVPIGITIMILIKIFILVDNILQIYINRILPFEIPGLGFIILFLIITIIGYLGKYFITQPLVSFFSRLMQKAPLIKLIYSAVKDLLSAFVGKEKKFNQPVLVKVNNISNLEKVGFLTQSDISYIGVEGKKVVVYFPHSYAFSGEHYIVPAENVKPINASPAEVMKFIVSAGVTKFQTFQNNNK